MHCVSLRLIKNNDRENKIYGENFPSAWPSDEYIHLEKSM